MTPVPVEPDTDLAALAAIHASSFASPWSQRTLGELLAMPGAFGFRVEGGFILARAAAGEAEILTLAVRPDLRRHGTATALVRVAAAHAHRLAASQIFLEVATGNSAAQNLYGKLGFAEVGRRPGYYVEGRDRPEDALILRSNLPLSPLGK